MEVKEFLRIKNIFRPLASKRLGALELLDDAALVPVKNMQSLVVSTDALVEKVHFHSDERPDLIARKALRTNLSVFKSLAFSKTSSTDFPDIPLGTGAPNFFNNAFA